MLPEAECSLGIGTANRTPVLSFSLVFASVNKKKKKKNGNRNDLKFFKGK